MTSGGDDLFGLVGQTLEGRFRIERFVSKGGFGVVYEGHHLALDLRIALKVLKVPPTDPATREVVLQKFVDEAKTMAKLKHPNIVQVMDTGVSMMPNGEPAPWMALEWLDGRSFKKVLTEQAPLAPAAVLTLLGPIFDALAAAHDEGIAHRDIKPDNMMMVKVRRTEVPKLLDFGIAKLMAEGESAGSGATSAATALHAFSPYYAAPEQVGKARTGPWTDVHAMGLIVTEALTGRHAIARGDYADVLKEILSDRRPTPLVFGVDVGAWEPVLARALAYRPDQRFPNAQTFHQALREALPGATNVRVRGATGNFAAAMPPGPAGLDATPGVSSTTLRSGVQTLDTPIQQTASTKRSRALLYAGGVAALLLGLGGTLLLTRGASNPPAALPSHAAAPAMSSSAATAPTTPRAALSNPIVPTPVTAQPTPASTPAVTASAPSGSVPGGAPTALAPAPAVPMPALPAVVPAVAPSNATPQGSHPATAASPAIAIRPSATAPAPGSRSSASAVPTVPSRTVQPRPSTPSPTTRPPARGTNGAINF